MTSLVKIGSTFINLDRVLQVDDLFARTKEDKLIVRFDCLEQTLTLSGQDADDLRTWLNSIAVNLHAAADPDAGS
jgi:hypothetical protein